MNSDASNQNGTAPSPTKKQRRDGPNRRGGHGRGTRPTDKIAHGAAKNRRNRRPNRTNSEWKDTPVMQDVTTTATPDTTTSLHQFSTTLFSTQSHHISAPSQRALSETLHYSFMTKVQEATLPSILTHHDVVAKAKTGSGKTTAFLLPILERLLTTASDEYVTAVVLSPTRELTQQISVEFEKLSSFHSPENRVYLSIIGGTNIEKDKKLLGQKKNLRLLLATPGRLQDHLNQNTSNLVKRLSQVQILCLDEADRLLDMGFRDALKVILGYMPWHHSRGERQTLLFSATFPESLQSMTQLAVRPDHRFIDTLEEQESDANIQVLQQSLVVPLQHHILAMHHILQRHIQERTALGQGYKVIVFFTTARIAGFMAELFTTRYSQHYTPKNLWEIHSRKNQNHRLKVSRQFTDGNNCFLFSSDVSARGVDYPNVTLVLQVGAPSEKAQYIHRLGRTARAGQAGTGVILLCDFERVFLKELEDLDVMALEIPTVMGEEHVQEEEERGSMQRLLRGNDKLRENAEAAYQAFLGYYNSNVRRLSLQNKHELVRIANEYATVIGFLEGEPPALLAKTVGKMGLKDVPGIRIDRERGGGGGRGRGNEQGRGRGSGGRGKGGRGR